MKCLIISQSDPSRTSGETHPLIAAMAGGGSGARTRVRRVGSALFKWVACVFLLTGGGAGFVLMLSHQKHQDQLALLREAGERELQAAQEEIQRLKDAPDKAGVEVDRTELVKLRGEVAELRRLQREWQQAIEEHRKIIVALQSRLASVEGGGKDAVPGLPAAPLPAPKPALVEGVDVGNLGDNDNAQGTKDEAPIKPLKDERARMCVLHLQGISGAKATWALEFSKRAADVPTDAELFGLNKYLSQRPVCPSGGAYVIGAAGENPRCSVPGHSD